MPLFSPSKRDKHSRSPTPASRQQQQEEITPLRSRVARQSNVLPLTTQDSTTPRRRPRTNANNFLAGGMYVERKRTRRRHYPKSSLWYHLHRRSIPAVLLLSILCCSMFFAYCYHHVSLFGVGTASLPITDPAIHLPPTSYTEALLRERIRLRKEAWGSRFTFFEELVPKWVHRNDYEADEVKSNSKDDEDTPEEEPHHLRSLANMDTYPNQSSCSGTGDKVSVTLVVQTSPERLWILQETCQRWSQPIIAVVAVNDVSDISSIVAQARQACPTLDLVVEPISKESPYPVNLLRNMGLDRVRTSHVLVADIDFVPSQGLDEQIIRFVKDRADRDAMIIPAFQRVLDPPCTTVEDCKRHLESDGSFLPRTFDELTQCHEKKECIVFQSDNNWEGHSSTGSEQWLERHWMENDKPRQLHCFDSMRYEPYVVLRWCPADSSRPLTPYYDEGFHGYGKNKIQLISHIRFLGYKFFVLPEGFIVHNPHVPSSSKREWENSAKSSLHEQMDRLYETFLRNLFDKYYKTHRKEIVDQCKQRDKS